MKLMIREFLAGLKERDELDAILPDLLSELGYHVLSRPGRGTRQHGVDVMAVGPSSDPIRRVYLFTVKQGDLTRQEWDGSSAQSVRPSLNQIQDAFIPRRIPKRYRSLPVVICICVGGNIREQVLDDLTGYIERHTSDNLTFEEWNGDKIADLILTGVLREELLPKGLRSSFQKAVAFVDEPDVAYHHFSILLKLIREYASRSDGDRVTAVRQIYVCLWVIFVWARDADNLDGPYKCGEIAILTAWEIVRPTIGSRGKNAKALALAINQIIELIFTITATFLDSKILPNVDIRDGLSAAVWARSSAAVNIALFDVLGRISLAALWSIWLSRRAGVFDASIAKQLVAQGNALIKNNPALNLPISDTQTVDIALFLIANLETQEVAEETAEWLVRMSDRLIFAVRTHGKYPSISDQYRDLIEHPSDHSEEYFKEMTAGSTLIPLLSAWLAAFKANDQLAALSKLCNEQLDHCTLQLWLPEASSEDHIYIGEKYHGIALADLEVSADGIHPTSEISDACQKERGLDELSAMNTGYWPVFLTACRHYRFPVPPHFWINAVRPRKSESA